MFQFIIVLIICMLGGVEVDLFIPSFPEMRQVFHLSPFQVQLTLSVNFLAFCLCSLFAGTLGDRFNRRTIILGGLVLFVLGSMLCVSAVNIDMLIIGRFFQGAGIAGPAVLGYAVIIDTYPFEKQASMLGILNGIVTIAMAFAPTIGSYINLFFGWRGNFFLLLGLGIICLITSTIGLPHRKGDPLISLSPKSYWPLLRSPKLMTFASCICFAIVPFWVFVGMSSILYIESLGVSLAHFGYYQGAIAGIFSIFSLLSPKILDAFGQRRCFYAGTLLMGIAIILILLIALLEIHNPLIITGAMLVMATGVVFPINILFPLSVEVIENTKGRTSALIQAGRLVIASFCLQLVSYFYHGTFLPIGLVMVAFLTLCLILIRVLIRKKWVTLQGVKS